MTNNGPVPSHLLLDIDGVINVSPLRHDPPDPWEFRKLWMGTAMGDVTWCQQVADFLTTVVDSGTRISFCSTWSARKQRAIGNYATKFGLSKSTPFLDWTRDDDTDGLMESGKRTTIRRWMETEQVYTIASPTVWVDDMHGPGDLDWAHRCGVTAITPNAEHGLADPDVQHAIWVGLGRPDLARAAKAS